MKKVQDTSKLALNIETIRTLTGDDLLGANGGYLAAPLSSAKVVCSACPNCCPSDKGNRPEDIGRVF